MNYRVVGTRMSRSGSIEVFDCLGRRDCVFEIDGRHQRGVRSNT